MAPSMSVTRSVAIVGGLARQALFRRPSFRSTPWPADSSLASSGPRFILTCPLGVRQAPPTTERLVELHVGEETVAANLRERVLRRVELLLGFEHFEVIGQPLAIAIGRMLYGLRERSQSPGAGQLLRSARSPAAALPGAEHARADSPQPSPRVRAALQGARWWVEPDGRRVDKSG